MITVTAPNGAQIHINKNTILDVFSMPTGTIIRQKRVVDGKPSWKDIQVVENVVSVKHMVR